MSLDQLLSDDSSTLNFPTIRPTLNLNFARTKSLDPRITFTRSSGGSYVGTDGLIKYAGVNQPRFDHNPTTGESLGLLIEEQRTNLIKSSEDFTIPTAYWIPLSGGDTLIATNQAIAPDGTQTADKFSIGSASSSYRGIQSYNYTAIIGQTYTASIFLKAENHPFARVQFQGANNSTYIIVNLLNGSIINTNIVNNIYQYSITPYPNGWWRVSVSSIGASPTGYAIRVYLTTGSGDIIFVGTPGNGVYLWGAQLEEGAFPTSYIPTKTFTRTRSADNASMTGTNFSSWYNQSEGTAYTKFIATSSSGNLAGVSFDNSTANERIQLRRIAINDRPNLVVVSNGTVQSSIQLISGGFQSGSSGSIAASYAINKFFVSFITGSGSNNKGILPISTQLTIGNGPGASIINGTISRLTYYPKRLPDSQLQALTK